MRNACGNGISYSGALFMRVRKRVGTTPFRGGGGTYTVVSGVVYGIIIYCVRMHRKPVELVNLETNVNKHRASGHTFHVHIHRLLSGSLSGLYSNEYVGTHEFPRGR